MNMMLNIKPFTISDARTMFPPRDKNCNKGDFGYIAIVGGSLEYSGAVRLAAMASCALRAGAGVASIAAPRSICHAIIPEILDATVFPLSDTDGRLVYSEDEFTSLMKHRRVIAFGPGLGRSSEVRAALEFLLHNYDGILIIDADGLNCLSEIDREVIRTSLPKLVLTPHMKEFSRLSGIAVNDIIAAPAESAFRYASDVHAAVLLKGNTTYVTDGSTVYSVRKGCPGMATAGSGDVLTGILSAVCAFNPYDLTAAAAAGAYVNGLAGEIAEQEYGEYGMTAADTARCTALAVKTISGFSPV